MVKVVYKEAKTSFSSDAVDVDSLKSEISEYFVSKIKFLFTFRFVRKWRRISVCELDQTKAVD